MEFQNTITKYKKILIYIFFVLLIIISSFLYWTNSPNTTENPLSQLVTWTIAWEYSIVSKKIPYNAWYIDLTLQEELDETTINNDNISITAQINWNISLVWNNTIRYTFLENLEVWQEFSITLGKWIKSNNWEYLETEYSYDISVINTAKVVKITPQWDLQNLNQNIAIFFNMPMIALTNLDEKDKYPCPIKIEPQVEWTCKWTTSSVMEFIPKDWFNWATKYKISVIPTEWLIYENFSWTWTEIITPKLTYHVNKKFHTNDNIQVRFNFPVNLESLKEKLILKENGVEKNINLSYYLDHESNLENESLVIINIDWANYKYDTNYTLQLSKWIKPKYGNIETTENWTLNISSYPFLNSISAHQKVFSWSEVIDSRWYNNIIPIKNVFFTLNFEEEIKILDKNLFSFEDENWYKIDFDLEYWKRLKENSSYSNWKKVDPDDLIDNKMVIFLKLNNNLNYSSKYKLIISKNINKNIEKNIEKNFISSDPFEVIDYKFISYSKSCLYVNNELLWYNRNIRKDIFETFPKSTITNVEKWETIYRDEREDLWLERRDEEWLKKLSDDFLISKWYCPKKNWSILYVVNTRLNPNSTYWIKFNKDIEDKYWNKVTKWIETSVTTWNIKYKDMYLDNSVEDNVSFVPDNIDTTIDLVTINVDNVDVTVCSMDLEWYIRYSSNEKDYNPTCLNKWEKNIQINNLGWDITNTEINIEKDIIWWENSTHFMLVTWSIIWKWEQFNNIFIKWNLSINYENATNKKLLFITDLSWNQIWLLNIDFIHYDSRYEKNITNLDKEVSLNSKNNIYEFEDSSNINYIIASNDNYFWILDIRKTSLSNYDFDSIKWTTTSNKNYLYLYTDRPIYQPWDTVYLKWLLRNFDLTWYKKTNLKEWKLSIYWPNYKILETLEIKVDKNSNFDSSITLNDDISTWRFYFTFEYWNTNYWNNAEFYVEEYSKPVFKVDVEWIDSDYMIWDKTSLSIFPTYYFWWKMVNTNWEYEVSSKSYFFDAKNYSDYQFWEWYRYFDCIYWWYCTDNNNFYSSEEFEINEQWEWKIDFEFAEQKKERIYNFTIWIVDKDTSKVVNKAISTIVHNTDSYVWLKVPYYNTKEEWIEGEFIVLDYDANPISEKEVKVELIKKEWIITRKAWTNGLFYDDYNQEETLEASYDLITNENWKISKIFKPKNSWSYLIKATYTGSNWQSFFSSKTIFVSWNNYVRYSDDSNILELIADKQKVNVGENAYYTLETPINNWKMFISIEKDDWILDYFVQDLNWYAQRIEIPVKDTYYPNYYVRVFMIWTEEGNKLPIYKRALTSTLVNTEYKNLNVKIDTDKKSYKAWEKVWLTLQVKDSNWNPISWANWTISMVDESLLALVWNPKKDPYSFFYSIKRNIKTYVYNSLKNLISKIDISYFEEQYDTEYSFELEEWMMLKGSIATDSVANVMESDKWNRDGEKNSLETENIRKDFKDLAFWKADFITDEKWEIYIESDNLPDNLTTWVIETIVNTSEDNKIWIAYNTITTTQKVVINDNLPNFFGVWDKITLSPVIFNKTWIDWEFEINLNATNIEINWEKTKNTFIRDWESKTVNFDIIINDRSNFRSMYTAASTITIEAISEDWKTDKIEKTLQIKDTSTKEAVATVWSTSDNSYDEQINVASIKDNISFIKLNYWATLFNNILDSIEYLNNYSYSCSEQQTSSIMPNVYIKNLYNSVWETYDLTTKLLDYYDSNTHSYKQKSVDQIIKEYLVNIKKFQKEDWGFVYWYDINSTYPNFSSFKLTSYILKSLSSLREIWYEVEDEILINADKYLKHRFALNRREWCNYNKYNCEYNEYDRFAAIEAILTYNSQDNDAYKMYKQLELKNYNISNTLKKDLVLNKLANLNSLTTEEKNALITEIKNDVNNIVNNELVYNPRWAYIWKTSKYSRLENTALLLKVISVLWEKELENSSYIIENINRWIIAQKEDWNFWTTSENIAVIDAVSNYMISSSELKNLDNKTQIKLNWETIEQKQFNDKNKLENYTNYLDLSILQDNNTLNITKQGNWKIYYDLSMEYYLTWKDIKARDEWFTIIKEYYNYEEYNKIKITKKEEWQKYISWEISYDDMLYKKEIFEYLNPISNFEIWELIIVRNKIITTETRDQVAFEWYIPAWAELINPNLDTSWTDNSDFWYNIFSKTEYRLDRFFGYVDTMYTWIYDLTYLIKFNHKWEYYVKPSYISEFYNNEVFGRSSGEVIVVK